jgi:hypothetical protein
VIVSDNLPLHFFPPQNTKPNQPTKKMKKTLHTPSPWKHDSTWGIIKHGKSEICALHSGNLANANLIASAPDLLVALESLKNSALVVSELRHNNLPIDDDAWSELYNDAIEARSAIAKAKGEA